MGEGGRCGWRAAARERIKKAKIGERESALESHEGCGLEIGLIMCPPTSFSDRRTSASTKICSYPQKDFFNSIGHSRKSADVRGMSPLPPKAEIKICGRNFRV